MDFTEEKLILLIVGATSVAVVLVILVFDLLFLVRQRKQRAQKELEQYKDHIDELILKAERDSVSHIIQGKDEERKRIAQDLHDRLGSLLFTAKLHYRQIFEDLNSLKEKEKESYGELKKLLEEAVIEVRNVSHDLFEGNLYKFGFNKATTDLIRSIQSSSIQIISYDTTEIPSGNQIIEVEMYRIVQELLGNGLKHARAKHLWILVRLVEPTKEIELIYKDDGVGFDPESTYEGIGIKGMQNRLDKLQGRMRIQSGIKGTQFTINIPYEE